MLTENRTELLLFRTLSINTAPCPSVWRANSGCVNCSPTAFCFQCLDDVPRIADEVVPRERKLEAKPPLLWVQSAAQHEPSEEAPVIPTIDRKSTRLNSSHRCISYAVFCLK